MVEVVAVFEYVTDAKLQRTAVVVPVERVEIVANKTVQLVAFFSVPSVARWGQFLSCRWVGAVVVLIERPEVTASCVAVLASDLLARCFPKYRGILVVDVGVVSVLYVTIVTEVFLTASVGELIPEWGVGGHLVKQTPPVSVAGCFSSVGIRSLWPVAQIVQHVIDYRKR